MPRLIHRVISVIQFTFEGDHRNSNSKGSDGFTAAAVIAVSRLQHLEVLTLELSLLDSAVLSITALIHLAAGAVNLKVTT